jgi:hypothetical protein
MAFQANASVPSWQKRKAAEEAARRIDKVPEARSWLRHIAEPQGLRHVEVIHEQLFALELRRI